MILKRRGMASWQLIMLIVLTVFLVLFLLFQSNLGLEISKLFDGFLGGP